MSQMVLRLRETFVRFEKEVRELISGNSREIDSLGRRLASLENPGEPVVPANIKQARIPPRPAIMEAVGAGSDPK